MAGTSWTSLEGLGAWFRGVSNPEHTPSHCFHPGRNLGSELSARRTFKMHKRNTGFLNKSQSCLAFDCNGADIKGHPLQVCPYLGHLPGGGVPYRETGHWFAFLLRVGFGALLRLSTQHRHAVIGSCFATRVREWGTLVARSLGVCTLE